MESRSLRRLFGWAFRDRRTGRITVVQFPNLALGLFLGATAVRWLADPSGGWRTGLDALATGSLVWWAIDEMLRGVNPWRRLLGGVVLAGQLAGLR